MLLRRTCGYKTAAVWVVELELARQAELGSPLLRLLHHALPHPVKWYSIKNVEGKGE